MKVIIISALVAMAVSVISWNLIRTEQGNDPDSSQLNQLEMNYELVLERLNANTLSVSMEPEIAAWVRGTATTGADSKILSNAANSACFLTHIELSGIQSPEDKSSCSISVDEFTGFWQVTATVDEGGLSEVQCNARCVVWE